MQPGPPRFGDNDDDTLIPIREIWPAGTVIRGDYVIDRRLGSGGFGVAYLAHHRFLGTTHVIKRLHDQYASDADYVRKFRDEARTVRRLKGTPNIVEVEHMTQTDDGHLILVMEYAAGGELGALLKLRRLSLAEVIDFSMQIAAGLHAAHQTGLIHRDIKPQNILIAQDSTGRPVLKLIDFGLAADHSSSQTTSVLRGGTVGYAAPEQWVYPGKQLDGRADLYSLGVTMYQMLCGHTPYGATEQGAWIEQIKAGPPLPPTSFRPDTPPALSSLVMELLTVWPDGRPRDAGVVFARLDAIRQSLPAADGTPRRTTLRDEPLPLPLPSPLPPPPAPPYVPAPNRGLIVSGLLFVVMTVAGLLAFVLREPPPFAGDVRVNSRDEQKYVYIPAGTFRMGCTSTVADPMCQPDERPNREVTIAKGFWMGQTEVTVGAFRKFATNAVVTSADPSLPISNVNWEAAKQFCEQQAGGRLPAEAEWEYAARGGMPGVRYSVDLLDIAWYGDNAGLFQIDSAMLWRNGDTEAYWRFIQGTNQNRPHPVGQKRANAYGLFDMLGNVWEWCADEVPGGRVQRGGSWGSPPNSLRSSARGWRQPGVPDAFTGFRCVVDSLR
ncbi:hypothetical protein F183_A26070 [Bryobacterales bacterium F-183]|nr:hypothetical protein F183_A26070 [Bryobacterales bacterium F-183]